MAIDIGLWVHARTKLQADADAMALAGAQKLCAQSACDFDAMTVSESYAALNDLENTEIASIVVGSACDGNTSTNHDMITVRTQRTVPTFLAKLVGITSADIGACATARKAEVAGGTGIVPFGIEDDCIAGAEFGQTYTIKYDAGPGAPDPDNLICDQYGGNFGLLGIDTGGAGSNCGDPPDTAEELKLKRAICFGANRFLCAQEATECVGDWDDETCASYGIPQDDESCTATGNVSAIKDSINWRFENTSSACDTWTEVTFPAPTGGLRPECNPWLNSDSKLVIMIPVVDGLFEGTSGSKKIDIIRFAIFFLEGLDDCSGGGPGGGNCAVVGRFIQTSLSASYEGLTDLESDSSLTVVTLIN